MILTVQPYSNGKFRLGICKDDSVRIFKKRDVKVKLVINEKVFFNTKTTCGPSENVNSGSNKKGYDLCHSELSIWIKKKKYDIYKRWDPTKLLFSLIANKNQKVLKFVKRL